MVTLANGRDTDFSGITDSLLQQVEAFEHEVKAQSVGTVTAVYDGVAIAQGLADVTAMELVEFSGGITGLTLNLEPESVGIVVMGDYTQIEVGDEVAHRRVEVVLVELVQVGIALQH